MRMILLLIALLAPTAQATVSVNAAGKTLDQFFVMASEVFSKAVIVDPAINGTLKVYGVSHGNFQRLFYSILRAHNLSYMETDDVVRIYPKTDLNRSNLTNRQSLFDFIASSVSGVYITGSMAYHSDAKIRYEYAFVQSGTRDTFRPEHIGLKVTAIHSCLAQLSFDTYTTFVTCEPYETPQPVEDNERLTIPSLFDKAPEKDKPVESEN
ncbi:hypothetical protein C9J03_12030 [Photobacterium gaetbulicola]|uniref:hypothetical protein n=1 Tax=Photobacterium gaetbulicola TaxID=1295392 RepID=UPI0005CC1684|nr:hypothetical protein [Photobacterium gaetbulicola]PSU10312.1 hypothetical protein C9J03_12030 [Photobacterium gaetbulicola]